MTKVILRLEALALFAASLFLYGIFQGSWGMFIALFLTPDISFIGYAKNEKVGAFLYNLVHNYVLAFLCMAVGMYTDTLFLTGYGIILFSHVSLDRVLGFNLRQATTHS
ncbi:hypothetical protein A2801_04255 [Candidatus Woesebacteria bacterium RIFCSPHIGHO2_01_FULL_41_10]|uniref:DUF4260 domain-containing protein n=1 Tax=Candidatus Woesebacteria bacterium RIFCSPHIGHO2_01_FULL_41_10 TaxID=1802500 RepID=A0A1F7YLJ0_9BACT|nr:MAG: hypothetical protein A2801_04255 [Candidatus Woesebacteria bacterium RIFCSPHIGHO2_01_FULL_41_10]